MFNSHITTKNTPKTHTFNSVKIILFYCSLIFTYSTLCTIHFNGMMMEYYYDCCCYCCFCRGVQLKAYIQEFIICSSTYPSKLIPFYSKTCICENCLYLYRQVHRIVQYIHMYIRKAFSDNFTILQFINPSIIPFCLRQPATSFVASIIFVFKIH